MNTLSKTQNKVTQQIGMAGFKRLINEMKAKQFDSIRFAAYRTACKLRYIQQRTRLILMDVRGVVESFRQTGLYLMESSCNLDRTQIEMMIAQLYTQLSNRLPAGDQLHPNLIPESIEMLMGWLLYSYDTSGTGRLSVMALKVALSTLASGKPMDKFKYHFTLLTDPSGALIPTRFEQYLHDLLVLAVGVFEGPNFAYNSQASKFILVGRSKAIVIEEFLEKMLADPGPQCLLWLTIFHRLANIENVRHNVRCEGCHREVIIGFRYKCQRCHHYNLCQDCFWTGVTTGNHSNTHDVKEYTSSSKSHSRQFGHALRKSWDRQNNSTVACTGKSSKDYQQNQSQSRNVDNNQRMMKTPAGQASPCLPYRNTVSRIQAADNGQFRASPNQTMMTTDQNFTGNDKWNKMLLFSHQQHSLDASTKTLNDASNSVLMSSNSQPIIMTQAVNKIDRNFNTASPSSVNFSGVSQIPSMNHACSNVTNTGNWDSSLKHTNPPTKDWRQFYHDDEHRLIARYASTLVSSRSTHSGLDMPHTSISQDNTDAPKIEVHLRSDLFNQNMPTSAKSQKELIAKLEAKNKEILREIQRLRLEQQQNASAVNAATDKTNSAINNDSVTGIVNNPNLLVELRNLRHRKDELENRMTSLQESRLELMQQLESLMRVLNTSSNSQTNSALYSTKSRSMNQAANTISTFSRQSGLTGVTPLSSLLPSSSGQPLKLHGYGSPMTTHRSLSYTSDSNRSVTMGPHSILPQPRFNTLTRHSRTFSADEGLGGFASQPRRTFTSGNRTLESLGVDTTDYYLKQSSDKAKQNNSLSKEMDLRQNLLMAADNVTNAMTGLVKELQPSANNKQTFSQNSSPTSTSQSNNQNRMNHNYHFNEYESEYERALDDCGMAKKSSTAPQNLNSATVFANSRISSRILSEQRFLNELRARRQNNTLGRCSNDQTDYNNHNSQNDSPPGPAPKLQESSVNKGIRVAPPPLPPHRTRPQGELRTNSNGTLCNYGESDSEAYLYSDPECSLLRLNEDEMGPAMSLGRGREKSIPMENEKLYDIHSLHQKINSLNNGDLDQDLDNRHKWDNSN